jgi:hypothetical protein
MPVVSTGIAGASHIEMPSLWTWTKSEGRVCICRPINLPARWLTFAQQKRVKIVSVPS